MEQYFSQCETVVAEGDPFEVQIAVDRVATWLIENQAPEDVRLLFCRLLESKADETSSRHIAAFLRNVAANCRTPLLQC